MATVPQVVAPSVNPAGPPLPAQTSDSKATPQAFGAGIGQAIEQSGDMLKQHALEFQARVNDANATDLYTNATIELGKLDAEHGQLQGKARAEALPGYIEKVQAIQNQFRGQAQNPDVQYQFDKDFKRRMGYAIVDESKHAAVAMRDYENKTQAARKDLAVSDAAASAHDDERFKLALQEVAQSLATESKLNNWGPDQIKLEQQKAVSKLYDARLTGLALTDPYRAKAIFERDKDNIDGLTQLKIEKSINDGIIRVGSKIEADRIWNGSEDWKEQLTQRRVGKGVNLEGINPTFGDRASRFIAAAEAATNSKVVIESGARTTAEQAKIYADYQAGKVGLAAPPGTSRHEMGEALDIQDGPALKWMHEHADEFGVEFLKDPRDPGHLQMKRGAVVQNGSDDSTPITGLSGSDRLALALSQAHQAAVKQFPDDPGNQAQYEQTLISRLQAKYAMDHKVAIEQRNQRQTTVMSELITKQDGSAGATSLEQLSPQAQLAYNDMTPAQQLRMQRQMVSNAKQDVPLTPDRFNNFNRIMGLSVTNPDQFQEIVPGEQDLPRTLQSQIFAKQRSMQQKLQDTSKINSALRTVQPMLNDSGIYASRTDPNINSRYNQFVGAFDSKLQAFEEQHKKFPTEEEQRKIAAGLLTDIAGSGWFTNYKNFEVPQDFIKEITPAFKERFKRDPTQAEIFRAYELSSRSQQ